MYKTKWSKSWKVFIQAAAFKQYVLYKYREFTTAELRPKLCYEFHLASQGHAQRAPKQPVCGPRWVA